MCDQHQAVTSWFYHPALWTVVGGLITLGVAVAVEWFRKPRLRIVLRDEKPEYDPAHKESGKPAYLFHHLWARNKPIPRVLRWLLNRNPASNCTGTITFTNLRNGHSTDPMPIRWSYTRQPFLPVPKILSSTGWIFDPWMPFETRTIHCEADEKFDVAARVEQDNNWYGWSNKVWTEGFKIERRRLEPETYLVYAKIWSGDAAADGLFVFSALTDRMVPLNKFCERKLRRQWKEDKKSGKGFVPKLPCMKP
jgi:hypothetical protein